MASGEDIKASAVNLSQADNDSYSYYYISYDDVLYGDGDHNYTEGFHIYRGLQVHRWMLVVGILPVCVLGLVANTVSVWAWHALQKNNAVVLLFQCLGILDNVFLLLSAVRGLLFCQDQLSRQNQEYMLPLLYLSQTLSIHVTMVIGVFRWLTVSKSRRSQPLTRRHVLMACGGVGGWCSLLTLLLTVMEVECEDYDQPYVIVTVVLQIVGFVLPTLVLLVFSVGLLRIAFQHPGLQSKKKHRKTTLAVLSIAACSFLACPVAVASHLLVTFSYDSSESGCNWTCIFVAYSAGELLQVLNSSVNFLFYFFFASTFRPLLKQRFRRCVSRLRRHGRRKFSTSSGILRVFSESGSAHAASVRRQDNMIEATEVPTEKNTARLKEELEEKLKGKRTEEVREEPAEGVREEPPKELRQEPTEERPKELRQEPTEEPPKELRQEPTEEPPKELKQEHTGEPPKELRQEHTEEPPKELRQEHTEEPPKELRQEPTEEPTKEIREEPTEGVREEPTEEVREEPPKEPRQEPTEEPTEDPRGKPTAEPREASTGEPIV